MSGPLRARFALKVPNLPEVHPFSATGHRAQEQMSVAKRTPVASPGKSGEYTPHEIVGLIASEL